MEERGLQHKGYMRHVVRQWLMPEPIADDNLAYMRTLMGKILLAMLGMSAILLMVGISNHLPSTTPAAGWGCVVSAGLYWFTRRGYLTVCRLVIPAFTFTLLTILIVFNDGLRDEGILSYAFTLVLAGLLVGRRGIIVYTIIIIGTITSIGVAEISGVLVNPFSASTGYPVIITMDLFISFTAILLYLTIDNLRRSLGRSQDLYQQGQRELTQRILTEQALQQAKTDAELANRAKSNFLCSVSHELRTPLNQILGYAQLLGTQEAEHLSPKQVRYVRNILAGGKHLLSLIEDILTLSHLDLGVNSLQRWEIPLKPLLENSFTLIRAKDLKSNLKCIVNLPQELTTLTVSADESKLKQILFQLLSNAIKFTPDGGTVTLEAERREQEIVISITDTGIGIAPEHQTVIFENFYQVESGICGKTPGTGLGLPIVRRLVELHGGRLWVESAGVRQGSRFSFSLPR